MAFIIKSKQSFYLIQKSKQWDYKFYLPLPFRLAYEQMQRTIIFPAPRVMIHDLHPRHKILPLPGRVLTSWTLLPPVWSLGIKFCLNAGILSMVLFPPPDQVQVLRLSPIPIMAQAPNLSSQDLQLLAVGLLKAMVSMKVILYLQAALLTWYW